MTTEKKPTVKVEALEYHTHEGKAYNAGDTYHVGEEHVESIVGQKKARVFDAKAERVSADAPAAAAKPAKRVKPATASKPAENQVKPAPEPAKPASTSTAVTPLTTADISVDKGTLHRRDMRA